MSRLENKAKVLVIGSFCPKDVEILVTDVTMPENPILQDQSEQRWNLIRYFKWSS